MNWQLKCFCFFLGVLMIASCQAVGESPKATAPGEIEPILQSPSQVPTQMTVPEMTGTAQAFPTVIYPRETPLSPEQILDLSQWKTTSPDGNYVITCDSGFPFLFYVPTKTVIASTDRSFGCDSQRSAWSPDSTYVFLVDRGAENLYRWRVDGSQPEYLAINEIIEPKKLIYPGCNVNKLSWSPDSQYLAIHQCGLYVVTPADEETFKHPLLVEECSSCLEDFRWVDQRLLLVNYSKSLSIIHIPSGHAIAGLWISGGPCSRQIPMFSPDGRWIASDAPWCGGGEPGPNQSVIADAEDGSERVFSESFADRIDFIGWSANSSQLYLISRPAEMNALPDPRTPFGLLALDPETLRVRNLFEQAWFVSFNQDFLWAYIVFPVKNADGNFRLDGGLWEVGSSQLLGKQIMAKSLDERFLEPVPYFTVESFYSPSGEELGPSSTAAGRLVPAVWSHDNSKLATINAEHGLIVIDAQGAIRTIAQLQPDQEWFNSEIQWSDDEGSIMVDGVTWPLP